MDKKKKQAGSAQAKCTHIWIFLLKYTNRKELFLVDEFTRSNALHMHYMSKQLVSEYAK